MKEKIIHVLCEGQTEQSFVEAVLKPYLMMSKAVNPYGDGLACQRIV